MCERQLPVPGVYSNTVWSDRLVRIGYEPRQPVAAEAFAPRRPRLDPASPPFCLQATAAGRRQDASHEYHGGPLQVVCRMPAGGVYVEVSVPGPPMLYRRTR